MVEVFGFSGIDQRRLLLHQNAFACGRDVELEIDRLLLPQSRGHGVVLLRLKAVRLGFHRVDAGLSCGKLNRPASSVFTDRFRPFSTLVTVTVAPEMAAPRRIGDRPDDRAGGLALSQQDRAPASRPRSTAIARKFRHT